MTAAPSVYEPLLALFRRHGSILVETPILQPAGRFLDLSGESIRRRLFITQDAAGGEFCLRPEHTIPVCLAHVRSGRDAGEYCYLGPVFRQRTGEPSEFQQAGIESIGRKDVVVADAEVFAVALEALSLYPGRPYAVTVGDMGLLDDVLAALSIGPSMRRRLVRQLAAGTTPDAALRDDARSASSDYAGLLDAIRGQDPRAAQAFVEDVISIAGIAAVGGRSAAEIAERFLSRAADRADDVGAERRQVLSSYLAIAGDLPSAARAVRELAHAAGLAIETAAARFESRAAEIVRRGASREAIRFRADFARNMDYYTGFIFEMSDPAQPSGRYVIAGGRYDGLMQQLGAARPSPAVGWAFWPDRLGGTAT